MYKKWKGVAALSMAVLLGCLMPMGTMLAAEEDTEAVQESEADPVSDTDAEENVGNDANDGIEDMSETDVPDAGDEEIQVHNDAPVISITLNGENCKVDGLGGKIDYKYVNYSDVKLSFSASQGDNTIFIYYYLDQFDDMTDNAKDEAQMTSLWPDGPSSPMQYTLSPNKKYVLYVKAEADGQVVYARSCGIVVDTIAPQIVGLENGKAYPEGTTFKVEDANLESVLVNETPVTPDSNGNYQVIANGTSCVIRVKDKAGNEACYSITVTARTPEENGVISANGTYSLKAGTSYKLAEGNWQVSGDNTVYQGGSAFYVKTDGNYSFTKR